MRTAVAWLAFAAAAPATAGEPLILGMLVSTGNASVLRLMARIDDDGRWRKADDLISAAMAANRLGSVQYGNRADAPPPVVDLGTFASAVVGGDFDLREWHGHTPRGKVVRETAVDAAQMAWSCNRGWGLRLKADGPPVAGSLVANRAIDARYFVPEPDKDADTKTWTLASAEQEAHALAAYRSETSGRQQGIPDDIDAAALSRLPLQHIQARSTGLGTQGRLVSMSALRLLRTEPLSGEPLPEEHCEQPSLVYTALFHRDAAGKVTRLQSKAEVQDCSEGWSPDAKRQPWLVLYVSGKPYLLQMQYGLEAHSTGVYEFDGDGWTPAAEPMLNLAESGC